MEAGLPELGVPHFFLSKCYNAIRESIIALVQANTLTHNTGMGEKLVICEREIHELIGTNEKAFLSSINTKLVETLKWEN